MSVPDRLVQIQNRIPLLTTHNPVDPQLLFYGAVLGVASDFTGVIKSVENPLKFGLNVLGRGMAGAALGYLSENWPLNALSLDGAIAISSIALLGLKNIITSYLPDKFKTAAEIFHFLGIFGGAALGLFAVLGNQGDIIHNLSTERIISIASLFTSVLYFFNNVPSEKSMIARGWKSAEES